MGTKFEKKEGSSLFYEKGAHFTRALKRCFEVVHEIPSDQLHVFSPTLLIVKDDESLFALEDNRPEHLIINHPLVRTGDIFLNDLFSSYEFEPHESGILLNKKEMTESEEEKRKPNGGVEDFLLESNDTIEEDGTKLQLMGENEASDGHGETTINTVLENHENQERVEESMDSGIQRVPSEPSKGRGNYMLYQSPYSLILLEELHSQIILDTIYPGRKRILVDKSNPHFNLKEFTLFISTSGFLRKNMDTSGAIELPITDVFSFPDNVLMVGKDDHRITWQITSRAGNLICAYNDVTNYKGKVLSSNSIQIDFDTKSHIGTYDYINKKIVWDNRSEWIILDIEKVVFEDSLNTWDIDDAYKKSIEKALSGEELVDTYAYHPELKVLGNQLIHFSHVKKLDGNWGDISDILDTLQDFFKKNLPRNVK